MLVNTRGYELVVTVFGAGGSYTVYGGRIEYLHFYVVARLYRARHPFRMLKRPAGQLTQPREEWAAAEESSYCEIDFSLSPPAELNYVCRENGQQVSTGRLIRMRP